MRKMFSSLEWNEPIAWLIVKNSVHVDPVQCVNERSRQGKMFSSDTLTYKANITTDQLFLSANYPEYDYIFNGIVNSSHIFNVTDNNSSDVDVNLLASDPTFEVNLPYTVLEILVAIIAIIGNAMVICVFQRERRLRRRTNYYIVSLAMADLLVGLLGVPFAILASVGLPTNLYACLFTVSLLVVLCTISIFCLVAVSVDRYWAILYPLAYSRNVRTKTAIGEFNLECLFWKILLIL